MIAHSAPLLEVEDAILTMSVLTMSLLASMAILEVEEAPLVGEAVQSRGALPHKAAHLSLIHI